MELSLTTSDLLLIKTTIERSQVQITTININTQNWISKKKRSMSKTTTSQHSNGKANNYINT